MCSINATQKSNAKKKNRNNAKNELTRVKYYGSMITEIAIMRLEVIWLRVNTDMLRGKIVENGYTQEKVSVLIGMDRSTFSRKMSSSALDFSVEEMHKLCDVLNLNGEEAVQIFLSE